jgi:uncharacterized protein YkwD
MGRSAYLPLARSPHRGLILISRLARPFAAVLAAAAITLSAAAAPAAALPPPSDTGWGEARILWLLNEERRVHGLPPVVRNAGADYMAQYSADVQAWYGRLGHNPNLGSDVTARVTPYWRFAGENVGCGFDADNLHGMWMNSAGHAANVLRAGVDTIGIGATYARGCLWATVVFVDT